LTYFEDDDEKLEKLYNEYKAGTLLTGEMKKECIAVMQKYVKEFQERRKTVTDGLLKEFMTPRKLEWKGNPKPKEKPQPPKKEKKPKEPTKNKASKEEKKG
jgi:tryptophanyl-tRNA synthetase